MLKFNPPVKLVNFPSKYINNLGYFNQPRIKAQSRVKLKLLAKIKPSNLPAKARKGSRTRLNKLLKTTL